MNETMQTGIQLAHYGGGYADAPYWVGHAHGPLSIFFVILTIVAVLFLAKWAFRKSGHCGHAGVTQGALESLSQKFVNGDIDEEEFRLKRSVLKSRE